jgi:kinetochor protein Mis14/NSL1
MDPHHRKIDLQSPQDLTYLLANIHAAAQQKVDIHFPPSAAPKGEEDAFRTRVEQLVQEVSGLLHSPIASPSQ